MRVILSPIFPSPTHGLALPVQYLARARMFKDATVGDVAYVNGEINWRKATFVVGISTTRSGDFVARAPGSATPASSARRLAAGPNAVLKLTFELDHPMGAGQRN
jgi:hypothetical protein